MQKAMQRHAAVFRTEEVMKEGVQKIADVYEMRRDMNVKDRGLIWNSDLIETLELENLLRTHTQYTPHTQYSLGQDDHRRSTQPQGVPRRPRPR